MSRHLQVRVSKKTTVVGFKSKRIFEDVDVEAIDKELRMLIDDQGRRTFIFCFEGLEFVTKKLFDRIYVLDRFLRSVGGSMGYCCLDPAITMALCLSGINGAFRQCTTDEEAKALAALKELRVAA